MQHSQSKREQETELLPSSRRSNFGLPTKTLAIAEENNDGGELTSIPNIKKGEITMLKTYQSSVFDLRSVASPYHQPVFQTHLESS